jgi:hypothetical protein
MPAFTSRVSIVYEILQSDQYAVTGRTIYYLPASMKVTAADRRNSQIWVVSADLSAEQLSLNPLGVSAPGAVMMFLSDQEVDVRFNSASDATFLSAVTMFVAGANISNMYITTGSAVTTILLETAGGSNAVVTTTLPVP